MLAAHDCGKRAPSLHGGVWYLCCNTAAKAAVATSNVVVLAAYYAPLATALVFIGAAITDAVDGYLARKVGQFARFLHM